jgi:hypothetical protein
LGNDLQFKAREEEEARDLLKKYKEHLAKAKLERNYYNKNTKLAEEHRKLIDQNYSAVEDRIPYCSTDTVAHYSYDWAQNLHVPHSDQQIGKVYYLSARKVDLFGIKMKQVEVIKRSSISGLNKARRYNGREAFQYYDILSGLVTFFRKLPGMQSIFFLPLAVASPGVVQALELLVALLKNSSYFWQVDLRLLLAIEKIKALSFPVLMPPPMKYERQDYLYNYIRPFVRDDFKDVTWPKPVAVGNTNED